MSAATIYRNKMIYQFGNNIFCMKCGVSKLLSGMGNSSYNITRQKEVVRFKEQHAGCATSK